jgi:AraC-like DNA-binding protein/transcriptional regulator with XRE-family HTH domain
MPNSATMREVESGGRARPAATERRRVSSVKREGQSNATNSVAPPGQWCYFDELPTLPGILPMARPARKQRNLSQRSAGLLSRIASRYAERHGVEVAPLLSQAGVSQKEFENQGATIGVANQIKFVELIAAKLGDEFLGFRLAEDFELGEIGLLYYVAASAATFGEAISRIQRYIKIQNDGVDFEALRGKTLRLRLHYTGIARHTDVHQMGSMIALMIRIGRRLTGRPLNPTRVRIMHHIHRDKAELEKLLDADVEDGARVDEVEFPKASWDLPIVSADPHLHSLCVQSCEEALARRGLKQTPLKVQVENAIAPLLPHGQARHDLVAAELGMSPRTLARRLTAEGSSFAGILTEVRSALADRYLAEGSLPISQIAWLLGYAEVSGFTRAFQRWTGMPPSAARARQPRPDAVLVE